MTDQELKECREEFEKWARHRVMNGMEKEFAWDAFRIAWSHRTAPEWQPIETAPKDGSKILIYDGDDIYAAWWEPKFHLGVSENAEEFTYLGAWTDDAVASFNYEETFEYQPTHWMPLPAEPKRGDT